MRISFMAHIVEFKVASLAGRKDIYTQKLDQNLNVFFGTNGSGKTSLLKILHSALSNETEILQNVAFDWAEVIIYSVDYKKNFLKRIKKIGKKKATPIRKHKIEIDKSEHMLSTGIGNRLYAQLTTEKDKKISWVYEPKLPRGAPGSWRHTYLPSWRFYMPSEYNPLRFEREWSRAVEREYDWDIIFARGLQELWSRYSNQLLSEVQAIQGEGLVSIMRGILSARQPRRKVRKLEAETAYHRVAAFLERQGSPDILGSQDSFAKKYEEDRQLRGLVSEINTIEQRIEKASVARTELQKLIRTMFSGNKTVIFKDSGIEVKTDEGENIGLASLSSGEKQALSIFIEVIRSEIGCLLIDEPEISMHIDWQRNLISAMRQLNPNTQLILATHSPEIMADIADENIFRL